MDGLDPDFATRHRARLQRLAARLRPNRSQAHVRRHHGRAARYQRRPSKKFAARSKNMAFAASFLRPNHVNNKKMERSLLRPAVGRMRETEFAGGLSRSRPSLSAPAGVFSHLLDLLDVQYLRLSLRQHARLRRHDLRRSDGTISETKSSVSWKATAPGRPGCSGAWANTPRPPGKRNIRI